MTEGIVDSLEAVDIDKQKRDLLLVTQAAFDLRSQVFHQIAIVEELGQIVGNDQAFSALKRENVFEGHRQRFRQTPDEVLVVRSKTARSILVKELDDTDCFAAALQRHAKDRANEQTFLAERDLDLKCVIVIKVKLAAAKDPFHDGVVRVMLK